MLRFRSYTANRKSRPTPSTAPWRRSYSVATLSAATSENFLKERLGRFERLRAGSAPLSAHPSLKALLDAKKLKVSGVSSKETIVGAAIANASPPSAPLPANVSQYSDVDYLRILQEGHSRDNEQVVDLHTNLKNPISEVQIRWLTFDSSAEGKQIVWHSTSHFLGAALELYALQHAKAHPQQAWFPYLLDGPALPAQQPHLGPGYFYDFELRPLASEGQPHTPAQQISIKEDELVKIEAIMKNLVAEAGTKFERLPVTKAEARHVLEWNPHKIAIIDKLPEDAEVTLYKSGAFVDLCRGPHVTLAAKAIAPESIKLLSLSAITSASSSKGQQTTPLYPQFRIYGISFPNPKQLAAWEAAREEASKRDHRVIGKHQKLFMFHPYSPGSPFFLPHGTRIFNKLQQVMRSEYETRGFQEVITPLVFNKKLWEMSGHWKHYSEDMFFVLQGQHFLNQPSPTAVKPPKHLNDESDEEEGVAGLKPMNCPSHCLIFAAERRSYKDLPLRFADFSSLHRNEAKGALTGLTRVRRFHQDDAHIFCAKDQIAGELQAAIDFVDHVYSKMLKFEYLVYISTRPEAYMGELADWEQAEKTLLKVVLEKKKEYKINAGDGAFYGPKIDFVLKDALGRYHQCATIQLDFQLPQRFGLRYVNRDDVEETPVMIHRAVLGSLERLFAVLCEHTAGRLPLWLSPRQICVVPISDTNERVMEYAKEVTRRLKQGANGVRFHTDLETSDGTMQNKIRNAQLLQYNYIVVIGELELKEQAINVRRREDGERLGQLSVEAFTQRLAEEIATFS